MKKALLQQKFNQNNKRASLIASMEAEREGKNKENTINIANVTNTFNQPIKHIQKR